MSSNLGRRVFKHGLVLTSTFLACAALHAADHADHKHGGKAEKFVHKAAMSGQMEVQMGQMAQQKAQSQELKSFGATLVRDHTMANQRLQQIASTKGITIPPAGSSSSASATTSSSSKTTSSADADQGSSPGSQHGSSSAMAEHAKHQKQMQKLQGQSGAEFDKAFARMAVQHHKKDIAEFERARTEVDDPELKAFIDETLPKLRNHLQIAQSAARSVGLDEASLAADRDDDSSTSAVGSPASGTRGSDKPSSPASEKPRSSIDRYNGATDTDASGTIRNNNTRASVDANVGDASVSADADVDVDTSDKSITADADVDTDKKGKVFQKGDGKVLGLSTDKSDGKFLGIIPNPRANKDQDVEVEADTDRGIDTEVNVDKDDTSVGGSATVETGSSKKD